MATLYILCGPSGSGKSYWAHNFIEEHPDIYYVSRDEIRFSLLKEDDEYFIHEKEVFQQFSDIITQKLVDGVDVIADATHINEFSRKKLTNKIDQVINNYQIVYVIFNTDFETCCQNDSQREGRHRVGPQVIRGMFRSLKAPVLQEDTRAINVIEVGEKVNDFSYLIDAYRRRDFYGMG